MKSIFDVIVAGRAHDSTGIGSISWSILDSLKGFCEVEFLDSRKGPPSYASRIGVFTDVLENYSGDQSYRILDNCELKGAFVFFDSDKFPDSWVEILNSYFDFVLVASQFVKNTAISSGVKKPVFYMPLRFAFDTNSSFVTSRFNKKLGVKFLSVGAFHPRKNHKKVVQAFVDEFEDHEKVSLQIHSNLYFKNIYEELEEFIKVNGIKNVFLSKQNIPEAQVSQMMANADVFVSASKGEGYGIPLRQALLNNKIAVALDTSSYSELNEKNLIKVPAKIKQLGFYPEVNCSFYGHQFDGYVSDLKKGLREAYERVRLNQQSIRRPKTNGILEEQLSAKFIVRSFFKPVEVVRGNENTISIERVQINDDAFYLKYRDFVGLNAKNAKSVRKSDRVIVGHDGGFFSVFNTYFSHMVWGINNGNTRFVLPDWSVVKIQKFHRLDKFTSFCYGQQKDKNIWTKLFMSPYEDISEAELDDEQYLYKNTKSPEHNFNEVNEPNLTYIHAAKLYSSPDFLYWRRWYNAYFKKFIRLQPKIQSEVDTFVSQKFSNKFVVCAHIRHPSHAMEQPDGKIPNVDKYLNVLFKSVKAGLVPENWHLFVATDQEKVIKHLRSEIGDRLIYVDSMARTTVEQDNKFENLSSKEKMKEGFQIQHLMASNTEKWSVTLGEQIIVDAFLLSKGQVFLHSVSNVATAVSFINPDIKMIRVTGV